MDYKKKGQRDLGNVLETRARRNAHTNRKTSGQRKYLGENENFISGPFYEALLTQTIKRSTSKHHGKLTVSNTAGSRLGWRRF